jgi:hypothetical protein
MAAQLEKSFSCFTCKQQIKLQRKDDDSGWLKYNLDGTEHKHSKAKSNQHQKQKKQQTLEDKIDNLTVQLEILTATIKALIQRINSSSNNNDNNNNNKSKC